MNKPDTLCLDGQILRMKIADLARVEPEFAHLINYHGQN